MKRKLCQKIKGTLKNRLFLLVLTIGAVYGILFNRLYELQIIKGAAYASNTEESISRILTLPALRGNIYDRYGRELAINTVSYCVKLDPAIAATDQNAALDRLLELFKENNTEWIDEFPITQEEPYEFTFLSLSAQERWKKDMGFENKQMDYNAAESLNYLREFFGIAEELPRVEVRDLIALRSALFLQRFRQYNNITLAKNVNIAVVTEIEVNADRYPGVFIDEEALRSYPEGENFSHILGYIRPVSAEEYQSNKDKGYTESDLIGKLGIEKSCEEVLSGQKGEQRVTASITGKIVNKTVLKPAVNGGDVFLTLDSRLQRKTAEALLDTLKKIIVRKLENGEISTEQLMTSMIRSNNISLKKIIEAKDGSVQNIFKNMIKEDNPRFNADDLNKLDYGTAKRAKEVLASAVEKGLITPSQFVLCLYEQALISCDAVLLSKMRDGTASASTVIKEKIISGELAPGKLNLDPCTGSAAVIDVQNGDVLALVTYPSYDNNMLVNQFNNEYYQKLLNDPATPMVNRPLAERKAPGSTFKMLSAIAALESGVISPDTEILDQGEFTKAYKPYAKCLIFSRYGQTHGLVNISKAIEVSCNYFFYEIAYRMGNAKEGTTLGGIAVFNDYMRKFGLADYSGVEIEEMKPNMATPEAKEKANGELWTDGDTIRSAIGQSVNSYAPIHMAKYAATLANGGTRYRASLVERETKIAEEIISIQPENLKAVHAGMLGVTKGSGGALRNMFSGFPVEVAGKTGTAEEAGSRPSHTWFVGFAPYEQPQIAVAVLIPFGETSPNPAAEIAKEIFAEYLGLNASAEIQDRGNILIP